jgi:hypothetical protein
MFESKGTMMSKTMDPGSQVIGRYWFILIGDRSIVSRILIVGLQLFDRSRLFGPNLHGQ